MRCAFVWRVRSIWTSPAKIVRQHRDYGRPALRWTPPQRQHGLSSTQWTYPRSNPTALIQRRGLLSDVLPPVLIPPVVFFGLLIGLWTYKCMMTVLFQDKIIYMPYMPPYARGEQLEDYTKTVLPAVWKEHHIRSLDNTKLVLATGTIPPTSSDATPAKDVEDVLILYFHGNGASIPPRLPLLSNVLRSIQASEQVNGSNARYTIVVLSYRGYWKSSGRASQSGIELDSQAMLRWVDENYNTGSQPAKLVLWGQSIGAGIAAVAAASHQTSDRAVRFPISGLVLETPFTSIKSMLLALYPQKWLPYQYLWPFLWNHWDTEQALRSLSQDKNNKPKILLIPATRDEVVPPEEIEKIHKICCELDFDVQRKNVIGALHTEASSRREGQEAVADFVRSVAK